MNRLTKIIKDVLSSYPKKDCGCGCHGKCATNAPMLNENLGAKVIMTENMKYHIDNKKPLIENTFRYGSKAFLDLWAEARYLYSRDAINLSESDKQIILETHLGERGLFNGELVPLDLPMEDLDENQKITTDQLLNNPKTLTLDKETSIKGRQFKTGDRISVQYQFDDDGESFFKIKGFGADEISIPYIPKKEMDNFLKNASLYLPTENLNEAEFKGKEVQLGKPKRGGSKKFFVYVKDPKTKKVKKVSFGDTTGLSAKINNPKARKAFAARHNCKNKKDRTKAGYWSCNLGRYAKSLGMKNNFSGYW
jgi:hypothetical protein